MHLDSIESELILSYGSKDEGMIQIDINVDGVVSTTKSIKILSGARVLLERSARPQVAGDPITGRLRVLDAEGNLITGFSSVANITLPE